MSPHDDADETERASSKDHSGPTSRLANTRPARDRTEQDRDPTKAQHARDRAPTRDRDQVPTLGQGRDPTAAGAGR